MQSHLVTVVFLVYVPLMVWMVWEHFHGLKVWRQQTAAQQEELNRRWNCGLPDAEATSLTLYPPKSEEEVARSLMLRRRLDEINAEMVARRINGWPKKKNS